MNAITLHPKDPWDLILSNLTVKDFCRASRVSKKWRERCIQEVFLKKVYKLACGEKISAASPSYTWKQVFDACGAVYANIRSGKYQTIELENPDKQAYGICDLNNFSFRDGYYVGQFRKGKPSLWDQKGGLLYHFSNGERILDIKEHQFLLFDKTKADGLFIHDMRTKEIRSVPRPKDWAFDDQLNAWLLPEGKILAPLKKPEEGKLSIEFFIIDPNEKEKYESLQDLKSTLDLSILSAKEYFARVAIGISEEGIICPVCIPRGRIANSQSFGNTLVIFAEATDQDQPKTTVYLYDMVSKTARVREYPEDVSIALGENVLIEHLVAKHVVSLVKISDESCVGIFKLAEILKGRIDEIRELKAVYAKSHLFVIAKGTRGYTHFFKLDIKQRSVKEMSFPAWTFPYSGVQNAHIKWLNNGFCIGYQDFRPIFRNYQLCIERLHIYDFAVGTLFRGK